MTTEGFLLDTCAMIWIAEGKRLSGEMQKLFEAGREDLYVSAMSAWELGLLISKGRIPATVTARQWFEQFLELSGAELLNPTIDILIAASFLPQPVHNDPADRILIATARAYGLTLITRDRAILAYGAAGHVKTLAC
ncbi:type II toxin-antitoxin system VapC family toxin [Martelella soudanensis]|uniref:type II toxin-antitoxin system VapC family toxin n=1 Tax=unclassified Martelella TaxID=2629616 RepID=UPI0015DEE888|nr:MULTISPECIES: type II toxin-antitoxin system VapC family toxin [unclassified Martelella]